MNQLMSYLASAMDDPDGYFEHHGIKGQKWGIRRFQNPDGTLTAEGRQRYGYESLMKISAVNDAETKYENAKRPAVEYMNNCSEAEYIDCCAKALFAQSQLNPDLIGLGRDRETELTVLLDDLETSDWNSEYMPQDIYIKKHYGKDSKMVEKEMDDAFGSFVDVFKSEALSDFKNNFKATSKQQKSFSDAVRDYARDYLNDIDWEQNPRYIGEWWQTPVSINHTSKMDSVIAKRALEMENAYNNGPKLTESQISQIRSMNNSNKTDEEIAKQFGISPSYVSALQALA